jgi:tetratricopeptide (TPR) repeat protein
MSTKIFSKFPNFTRNAHRFLYKALKFFLKHTGWVATVSLLSVLFVVVSIPSFSFLTGNLFFGGYKPLYNVKLAQWSYQLSAYPLFSESPPRYAHYQLSRTYFIQGKVFPALDEAKEELKIYPDDTQTYYILGLTFGYLNRTHEAIDAFSRYIETHPGTWPGRNDKAWLQFRLGDIDGALATIEPIAESFRYTPWIQNTYCALLMNKGRLADAKQACGYAKEAVEKMTPEDWGHAYPGNDPRIYATGLVAMKTSIQGNFDLIDSKVGSSTDSSPF